MSTAKTTKPAAKSTPKKFKNIWEALIEARHIVSTTDVEKEGENKFAKYKYFTPSQVHSLVENACYKTGLFAGFQLLKEDDSVYGLLTVVHAETGDAQEFKYITDIADIKGANSSQKLGGTLTYAERYAKSSVFGITDNNLDLDAQTDKPKTTPPPQKPAPSIWESKREIFITTAAKEAADSNKTNLISPKLSGMIEKAQKEYKATGAQIIEALKDAGFENPKIS